MKRLIKENHAVKKICSKYVAAFDYTDQALIVLRPTSGAVSIISFTSIVGAPVGIARASLTLFFFSNNRNYQKITEYKKTQKEKA